MTASFPQRPQAAGWPALLSALAVAWALVLGATLAAAQAPVQIDVDGAQKFQTIDGFGTAVYLFAGNAQYRDPRLQQMYAVDSRNSLIRMNISSSTLRDKVENVEDVTRDKFQLDKAEATMANLDFVKAVVALNPRIRFTPSVWSPPGWMKSNGKAAGGGTLLPQYYPHFAKYLAEWIKLVKERYGLDVYAVSPQNELEFKETYESCLYTPAQWRDLLKEMHKRFEAEGLKTKVFGPESMTGSQKSPLFVRAVMEDPEARPALGIVATHGYSDGIKMEGGAKGNSLLFDAVSRYQLPIWMTETSGVAGGLLDGQFISKTNGRPMTGSLKGVAQEIHNSLVYGQVAGWIYWQYVGTDAAQNCEYDMVLVKTNRQGGQESVTEIVPSKKYFLHMQFSRFIQPGAVRIAATPADVLDVSVGAYEHAADKTVTVTLINTAAAPREVALSLKPSLKVAKYDVFRTSVTEDCAPLPAVEAAGGKIALSLPAQCMVTLYGKETGQ